MNRSKRILDMLEQKGRNKAVDTKGKLADKLSAKIEENETIELGDIMEEAEGDSAVEKLIADNIQFLLDRELGRGATSSVNVSIEDYSENAALGTYDAYFKDNSDYGGNFVADGIQAGESFELNSLSIGSTKLRYFGN